MQSSSGLDIGKVFFCVFYFLPQYLLDRIDVTRRVASVLSFTIRAIAFGWAATKAEIYWQRACNVLIAISTLAVSYPTRRIHDLFGLT